MMNCKVVHAVLLLFASLCLLSGCSARKAYLARHCYEEGRAAAKEHKWAEALAKYDQAIRLKPDYAAAYCNRGLVRWQQGDVARALTDYDQAIRFEPDFAEAYSQRGRARLNQGGRARLNQGTSDRSGNADQKQDYFRKALADFDQVIKLKPDLASAYFDRACAHEVQGNLERALTDYDQAIKLRPFPSAYFNRGHLQQKLGHSDEAIADYRKAQASHPSPEMQQQLQARLSELGAK